MASSTWIGSLDVNGWVRNLMNQEIKQITDASQKKMSLLSSNEAGLKSQVAAYGKLQTLLQAFQTNLSQLTAAFTPTYQVTSSNAGVAGASVIGTNVTAGSHTINVTKLAQASSIASQNFAVSSSDTALGVTETLHVGVGSGSFTVNVAATDSIQTIAQNINTGSMANNVGLTASVVSTASGNYQLVISSNQTGVANQLTISETGTGSPALNISTAGSGGTGGAGTVLTSAQDAVFTFDGLNFDQASNTNIMIQGLSINLVGNGTASIVVSTTNQITNVTTAMQNLVNAYNQIDSFIEQTQVSNGAPDSTMSLVLSSLQTTMNQSLGSGSYKSLADLGIVSSKTPTSIQITTAKGDTINFVPAGQLTMNTDPAKGPTLAAALNANFSAVQTMLTSQSGICTQLTSLLSQNGSITKGLASSTSSVSNQISGIDHQISDEQDRVDKLKKDLVVKYAKLDLVLVQLQGQSQYLSQQIAVMNNSNH